MRHLSAVPTCVGLVVVALAPAGVAAAGPATAVHINFEPASQPVLAGTLPDTGQGFSTDRGYGWIGLNDSTPKDMTANTRYRWAGSAEDPRRSTLLQMQQQDYKGGVQAGRWEYALDNGTYDVTVSVGDGGHNSAGTYCCLDSTHRLTVEGVMAVNDVEPSAQTPFAAATVTVAVSDGRLTIDPTGGVNTKIDYVDITPSTATAMPSTPEVTGITPARRATGVALNTSVSLDLSEPIDPATLRPDTMQVVGPDGQVDGQYNSDAAGGTVSFTPLRSLAVNTLYTVTVGAGLTGSSGRPFAPFHATFVTGTTPPSLSPYSFANRFSVPVPKPSALAFGPDGRLYVGTGDGRIFRFDRNADGTLANGTSIQPFGTRIITGLSFDPLDRRSLYVTNNQAVYDAAAPFSGRVSRLTVTPGGSFDAVAATAADVIIGLPRSAHDHMTNGTAFGPDGRLYIAQGANSAYGAPDAYWGPQGEQPLSASILVADVRDGTAFPPGSPVDVNTSPPGTPTAEGSAPPVGYDPTTPQAPVRVYASGVRNAFNLVWTAAGTLYAAVNESAAGGTAPAGPAGVPPQITNVKAYTDYLTRITSGAYYGHPNPSQGHYALNGANPTQGGAYTVGEYPVGTSPDPQWKAPDLALGIHRSPNGSAEYTSPRAFNGALVGKLLVAEYSNGDDLVVVDLDAQGKPVSEAAIGDAQLPGAALVLQNPLPVVVDPVSGAVYVGEYADESDPAAGAVTLLTPGADPLPLPATSQVLFGPTGTVPPTGYVLDNGAAFDGTNGWQSTGGTPVEFTGNTRRRAANPNCPQPNVCTLVQMQQLNGLYGGTATPGRWVRTLPNGTYDVTVSVGDAQALNSDNVVTAQPGTAEQRTIIEHFVPSASTIWRTVKSRVTVSTGQLVLDASGGSNTKLDSVVIAPATSVDTESPTVLLSAAGPRPSSTSTSFYGPVRVTALSADNVAVAGIAYSLDGAASAPYSGPVVVTGVGTHTVTVTARDPAGNATTSDVTFTITADAPSEGHVDFAPAAAPAVAGYLVDSGAAYDPTRGYGWSDARTNAPADFSGNTRVRHLAASPDARYDTLLQMQQTASSAAGTSAPGRWEYALANGSYAVTVAVGDAGATNSTHTIVAEAGTASATTLVDRFVPTASTPFRTVTVQVSVTDGRLTLDATGGTNTKIDFVDIVPAQAAGHRPADRWSELVRRGRAAEVAARDVR